MRRSLPLLISVFVAAIGGYYFAYRQFKLVDASAAQVEKHPKLDPLIMPTNTATKIDPSLIIPQNSETAVTRIPEQLDPVILKSIENHFKDQGTWEAPVKPVSFVKPMRDSEGEQKKGD